MPKAIASTDSRRFDLKTLAGGWVEIRRMSYGEKMKRQAAMLGMKVQGGKGKTFEGEVQMANQKVSEMEFALCVTDHNLFKDDEEQVKFDFRNPSDLAQLDGKVGEEIGTYIDEVNQFDGDDEGESSTGSDQR